MTTIVRSMLVLAALGCAAVAIGVGTGSYAATPSATAPGAPSAAVRPAAAVGVSAAAATQIPDRFTNLQILPADIGRGALVGIMRGFASGLGVRCIHCHVGGDPETLEGFDFASDDKEAKRVARAMLRMVEAINGEFLPATGREPAGLIQIGCYNCHRGITRPETLRSVLMTTYEAEGVEALLERYRALRERYYGRAAYDFGRSALSSIAERIARVDLGDAEALLLFNIELYPEWDYHYYVLGETRRQAGDIEGAREALERAVELVPDSQWYRDALERLGER